MGRELGANWLELTKKLFEPKFHQVINTPQLRLFIGPSTGKKLSSIETVFSIGGRDCAYAPPTCVRLHPGVSASDWSARKLCASLTDCSMTTNSFSGD